MYVPAKRRRARRIGVGLLPSLLVLLLATPALADLWYESYEKAEKALAAEDWGSAVQYLQLALQQRGESAAQARTYGMNFISYFPYLKLGIAHYQLGNYDAALQALEAEERAGAVSASADSLAELQRFRALAQQAKNEAESRSIRSIVTDNLAEAQRLEQAGKLDEARSALEQAQAVAPDDPQVMRAMDRVQTAIAAREQQRLTAERVATLLREGYGLYEDGKYGEAASRFSRARELDPDARVELTNRARQTVRATPGELLDLAQGKLAEELTRQRDAQERASMIDAALTRARDLSRGGEATQPADLVAALDELQSVLALDPGNAEARSLQRTLLARQAQADRDSSRNDQIAQLVGESADRLAAGDAAQALSAANSALALDPNNAEALRAFASAREARNRQLLGAGAAGNIPPSIDVADGRNRLYDAGRGTLLAPSAVPLGDDAAAEILDVEVTSAPGFLLTGAVSDKSPLTVAFLDSRDRPLGASVIDKQLDDWHIAQFTLRPHLRPGLQTFRIVATDDEGLSATTTYAVVYAPPWYRSRWIPWALVGAALALAGALLTIRLRRRRELLRRKFNPYVAGAPIIKQELFFGRQRLLDRVLQTVHNNSLLLYGERRIGKTSLQHHIKRRLTELDDPQFVFYPVYIDLQGTPEEKFFSTLAHDIFEELAPLLDGVKPNENLHAGVYDYREFVRDLREVLRALERHAAPKQPKLTLLIDEVDELNDYDPRVNQKLRSLFMRNFADKLVSVVSGVGIKKKWESEGSPWYNFFEEIPVTPFRREDAVELIERPIRGIFKLEPGAVDRIIGFTDCKPYLIQKLCISLVNRLYEEKRRTIRVADVESIGRPEEA